MFKFNKFAIVATASLFTSLTMTSCEDSEVVDVIDPNLQFEANIQTALEGINFEDASVTGFTKPSWAKELSYDGIVAERSLTQADATTEIKGDITENTTLSGIVYMSETTFVKSGVVLTIEAGTIILAAEGNVYLMIETGGKIMAEGTAENMIIFSSVAGKGSKWGGLILNGLAPINDGDETGQKGTEVNSNVLYGGADTADNSGVVSYVRVEYTGFAINAEKEHNGITLNGVGSGTTLENVQAHYGSDDGIEFFGGTVNLSNAVVTAAGDDQIDWAKGYQGTVDGAYIMMDANSDKGFEIDNNDKNQEATPASNATVKNVTLEGTADHTAIRFREGAKGSFENIKATNFSKGFDIHNNVTLNNLLNEEVTLSKINFLEVENLYNYAIDGAE